MSVSPWAGYLPSPSAPVSLQGKEVKLKNLKKRCKRGMARNDKGGVGGVGRPTLINSGSLLAFRTGVELYPPPGLTVPGTRPSSLQGQRASCPPSPFRQVPKPVGHSRPGSQPRSHSSLSVLQSLPDCCVLGPLCLTCPDPIPSRLELLQENYFSCLGSRSLHFLLLQM